MKEQSPEPEPLRVAIAAGGTGGHIMPAIALAQALSNIGRPVRTDFLCGNRPIELDTYAVAGIKPRVFPVGSLTTGPAWKRACQRVGLAYSFLRSLLMIRRYDVVVGMGGYISGPVLTAAWIGRVPIVLHESNTVLGRVNRLMAKRAKIVACGMPLFERPEEIPPDRFVEIGTPARLNIARGNPDEAAMEMYLRRDCFTLLVTGGSQGAQALNELVAKTLGLLSALWHGEKDLQVIWSTGPDNLPKVRAALENQPLKGHIYLAPTIEKMELAYALTDLVVGRAGAASLSEILLCGLPSILIPLPNAVGDHQRLNSVVLVRNKAAVLLDERETSPEQLAGEILSFATDAERRNAMSQAAHRLACPDAGRDLARIVVDAALGNIK